MHFVHFVLPEPHRFKVPGAQKREVVCPSGQLRVGSSQQDESAEIFK